MSPKHNHGKKFVTTKDDRVRRKLDGKIVDEVVGILRKVSIESVSMLSSDEGVSNKYRGVTKLLGKTHLVGRRGPLC